MGKREWGFPRNLGDPVVSTEMTRRGIPGDQPQARRFALGGGGRHETSPAQPWYQADEGNEVRREGRQEVAVP